MPPAKKPDTHPFDQLIQRAAEILADRLGGVVNGAAAPARRGRPPKAIGAASNGRRGKSPLRGKKLDMGCRVEGCKNRSGGPRSGFMCAEHSEKLSKKQQQAARDAWKTRQAA